MTQSRECQRQQVTFLSYLSPMGACFLLTTPTVHPTLLRAEHLLAKALLSMVDLLYLRRWLPARIFCLTL